MFRGLFVGMTPVSEAVMQLMGRCGERQLGILPGTKTPSDVGYRQWWCAAEYVVLERVDQNE